MPLLPRPYFDEVFGSVIARGCRRAGIGLKRMLKFMYSSGRSYASVLMSSDPRRDAMLTGIDADELIWRHTILPYVTAFFPSDLQAEYRAKALRLESNESLSSLVKNVASGVPVRRLCPDCVANDMQSLGETYWRRAHLLPGVEICTVHGRRLLRTAMPLRGATQSSRMAMPNEVSGRSPRLYIPMSIMQALAAVSDDALNGRILPRNEVYGRYRERALQRGYVRAPGIAARLALANDLKKTFGGTLLRDMGAAWSPDNGNPWPALMISGQSRQNHSTARHVLMETFLSLDGRASNSQDQAYRMPGPQPRDYAELDMRGARAVETAMSRACDLGERCGVREILDGVGLWSAYRHDSARFPKTAAALDTLRNSNQSLRQAGRRPVWRKRLGLDKKPEQDVAPKPSK